MASRVLAARTKFLLFVSVLSTCAGLAAVSTDQPGPGEAEPLMGSGEAVAISDTVSLGEPTAELPMPPPREPVADAATPPPVEPAATSELEGLPPAEPAAPAAVAPAPPTPPVASAPLPAPLQPPMPADAIVPLERAALKPI